MVKKLRIARPYMYGSFAIILGLIFLETFSFNTMQSIILLLPVLNEKSTMNIMDQIVTKVPVTFSILEFAAIPIGAFIVASIIRREKFLIWPLLIWPLVPMYFSMADSKILFIALIRIMALLKGFIQSVILSVGAQVYKEEELDKIYMYFMFTYCAYQVGAFGAQTLIPIDIIENNNCGTVDCLKISILLSSIAAILAIILYIGCWTQFAIKHEDKPIFDLQIFKNESYKVFCILFVLMPYGVFWIFYNHIIPQLSYLPKLINLLGISVHDVPKIYTVLKFVIAILYYYLVYKPFSNFILKHSTLLMTIGGILLGIWPIIAAPMVTDHGDQYVEAGPIKPDAIKMTYSAFHDCLTKYIDIPYYKNPGCTRPGNAFVVIPDQVLVTREENKCPEVWSQYDSLKYKYCFRRGTQYIWNLCDKDNHHITPDPASRDPYGLPVMCVLIQNAMDCSNWQKKDFFVEVYTKLNGTRERVRYGYSLFPTLLEDRLNETLQYSYKCQSVEPGEYTTRVQRYLKPKELKLESGGIYLIATCVVHTHLLYHVAVHPFKSTILDTRLIPMYIIQAVGEFLLITNGFYFVHIQIHQKFQTIAIAVWFMLIKFGAMIYEIQQNNDEYFQNGDLYKLGQLLIGTSILSIVVQQFFDFKNG